MKHLAELDDFSLGLSTAPRTGDADYAERYAARAIIFNPLGQIALLHAVNLGYHKLPGGGIEDGETWQDACIREALEEIGFHVALRPIAIGQIVEWRGRPETWRPDTPKLKQISVCGVADIVDKGNLSLSEEEIRVGLTLQWYPIDQAIEICEQDVPKQDRDQPDDYEGRFIKTRDLIFLRAAQDMLNLTR